LFLRYPYNTSQKPPSFAGSIRFCTMAVVEYGFITGDAIVGEDALEEAGIWW
jgi:hypothetical protein